MNGTMRAARAALVVLAMAAAVPARAQVQRTYDLAAAYLADPTLETAVWEVLRSEGPTGALTPLVAVRQNWGLVDGIIGHEGTESCNIHGCFPVVAINTTGADQVIPPPADLVVPAGAVWIHPANPESGANGNAAVGFRSPFTGWVSVSITLRRIHSGAVSWLVDLDGQALQAPEVVAPWATATFTAPQLKVKKGSLLAVRVDAYDGYGADSSTLDFKVVRVPGPEE